MLTRIKTALDRLFNKSRAERELDEELRYHIQQQTDQNIRLGMTAEDARRTALQKFGGVEQAKEESRDVRGIRWLEDSWHDLRHGARALGKTPGFSLIAILTLVLGIGSTTAIFSVVDAVLLRPLPYPDPGQIVSLREVGGKGGQMAVAEPNFVDIRSQNRSFSAISVAAGSFPLVVTGPTAAMRARVSIVSHEFLDVMGVQPQLGRGFLPEEDKYGSPVAALVSNGYWQGTLGARSDLAQLHITVDGVTCNVIGVMPADFSYPAETDVWMSPNSEPANTSRTAHNLQVIARIKSDVTLAQAQADVSSIGKQLRQALGEQTDAVDFALVPLQSYLTRNVREGLWLLTGAVGMLLLVACANFSNLLLAQFTARQREFVLRAALGAARLRMSRQLIVENLLLTVPSAILGAILASIGVKLLLLLDNGKLPRVNTVSIDGRVLLFACSLAVIIAIVLGLLPLVQLKGLDLQGGLKEGGRGHSSGAATHRVRGALVVAQISLTLVLLTGAGLLAHSFLKLMRVDPGFNTESAVAMTLSLPSTISPAEDDRIRQFYVQLLERAQRLPGVIAAGGINVLPLADRGSNGRFLIDNDPNNRGYAEYRVASAGYFEAMKIPLLSGRIFGSEDTVNSPHSAVISQSLAERYWPHESAVGKRIQFGNMDTDKRLLNVVGVVGDVRDVTLDTSPLPTVYAFSLQRPQWWQVSRLSIVVRSNATPETLIPGLRAAVNALRSDVPLTFRTMDRVLSRSLDQRRFSLSMFGVFGFVALLIAAIGIYGVVAYGVTQRTQEIGIRMALGAQAGSVLRLVIRGGMILAGLGVAIGVIAALALTRLLSSLLFAVSPTDPVTFVVISLALIVVALIACWIPARRASRVDPLVALRQE